MEDSKANKSKSDWMADLIYGFLLLSGGLIVAISIYIGVGMINGKSPFPSSFHGYSVILGIITVVIPAFTLGWLIIAIGKITSLLGIISNKK